MPPSSLIEEKAEEVRELNTELKLTRIGNSPSTSSSTVNKFDLPPSNNPTNWSFTAWIFWHNPPAVDNISFANLEPENSRTSVNRRVKAQLPGRVNNRSVFACRVNRVNFQQANIICSTIISIFISFRFVCRVQPQIVICFLICFLQTNR